MEIGMMRLIRYLQWFYYNDLSNLWVTFRVVPRQQKERHGAA